MSAEIDEPSVGVVLASLVRRPVDRLVRRWNWKSAVFSTAIRSVLFFVTNLNAGFDAARSALLTELAFRGATAGFYGALTQALRDARPAWTGTIAALLLVPIVAHTIEALVHWLRGTARLADSLAASIALTVVSTCYNLFAMRRGALIVGEDGDTIGQDLARTPALVRAFVIETLRLVASLLRRGRLIVSRTLYRVVRCSDNRRSGRA